VLGKRRSGGTLSLRLVPETATAGREMAFLVSVRPSGPSKVVYETFDGGGSRASLQRGWAPLAGS
jgi:hypothetical protein